MPSICSGCKAGVYAEDYVNLFAINIQLCACVGAHSCVNIV